MTRRILFILLITLSLTVSGFFILNQQMVNCMMVEVSYMDKTGHNIYMSPNSTPEEKQYVLDLVKTAKERNTIFWSKSTSDPVFIFCLNWNDYYKFGMYRTEAVTRMNYSGEYIIISPNGMNPDDVSHEMCHAELTQRTGYRNDEKIPLWFHEGLSMMVCEEYPRTYNDYLKEWEAITKSEPSIMPLQTISSDNDFYSSPNRSNLAYWRSGMEISRWLEKCGKDGLFTLIKRFNAGENFMSAYNDIEFRSNE
jgi:hypothetical protein